MAFASSKRFTTEALRFAKSDFVEVATKGLAIVTPICVGAGGKAIYDQYGDLCKDIKGLQAEQASLKATVLAVQELASEQKRLADQMERLADQMERRGKVLDSIQANYV
ncbi:hypothetical protein GPECTOR_4g824 [Gonium pectorale]|uniref:Uncharacterized protein n=1 Tax=Gonium pectorale TaxID=33097 RepID=A0A150GY86_GONPE|nr:hypothetical protein GPECTOR_4g824 [Gonium pectorale]|eukprot:KXZ54754.1 hypothetical protein GPECTOR_4g824 [Gonium pectorale]